MHRLLYFYIPGCVRFLFLTKFLFFCVWWYFQEDFIVFFADDISRLQEQVQKLEKEKKELEADFGVKFAKFKELFLQKEGIVHFLVRECNCTILLYKEDTSLWS